MDLTRLVHINTRRVNYLTASNAMTVTEKVKFNKCVPEHLSTDQSHASIKVIKIALVLEQYHMK